jgi:hypothetical protein
MAMWSEDELRRIAETVSEFELSEREGHGAGR